MIVSEICEYLDSRLKVPTEINGFLVSIIASLYQTPKIENLILWWFNDIMIFCEICEYLGPRLKVPTEINGFLLSIDASLYQKPKIENLILWWFYDFMILWYYDSEICEYLGSRLKVPTEINGFLVSIIASLYQRPKIENLILWWFYDIMRNLWISRPSVEGSNWNKRIPTLYRCLFVSETKNRKSNFMMILWFYDIMILL